MILYEFWVQMKLNDLIVGSLIINKNCAQPKLAGVSDSALSLFKKCQEFKPRSRMNLPLWPSLYLLQAYSVRTRINLDYGTDLKVSFIIEIHSELPRDSEKIYIYIYIRIMLRNYRSCMYNVKKTVYTESPFYCNFKPHN